MSILLKEQDARSFEVVFDTSMAGLFLAERAFLHAVIASLLLVHNSCLWYFPTALYGCGLIQVYHESQDWAHLISDLSLLGHLGLAYIVFSHIESSYCRWSGTQDAWLQNIPVVFVLEGAFAFSWGYALHSNIVMLFEFASYDGTWKSLAPICVQMALVTLWIALWLHTLFPAIATQLRSKSLWDSMSVLGMDLQDYPWTPEGLVGDIALSEDETCMDNDAKNIVTYGNIV